MPPHPPHNLAYLDRTVVWHPFTQMQTYAADDAPIIEAAEGFYLIDTAGRRYLDGHSSLWCNVHGHRVPEIDAAIRDQLDRVAHSTLLGLGNVPSIELAAELIQRAPTGLTRVFYTDCGAAGVEAALKMVWQYHRQKPQPEDRDLFACLASSYHGDTMGAVSVGGIDRFHSLFGGMTFPALTLPTPSTCLSSVRSVPTLEQVLAETTRLLDQHADRIAGVIVEPLVQAAAGILVHPPGYLAKLRQITRERNIPLIADEIAVGFGRTGRLFACDEEHVSPDIMILSKGLTGGYLPLAATLVTDTIYNAFLGDGASGRTFFHGHTYTGNPLACAAALASLKRFEATDVLANAREIETVFARFAESFRAENWFRRGVIDVRHRGTMLGIELATPVTTHEGIAADDLPLAVRITRRCRELGVILRNVGPVLVIYPAPAMPTNFVNHLCNTVYQSCDELLLPR